MHPSKVETFADKMKKKNMQKKIEKANNIFREAMKKEYTHKVKKANLDNIISYGKKATERFQDANYKNE